MLHSVGKYPITVYLKNSLNFKKFFQSEKNLITIFRTFLEGGVIFGVKWWQHFLEWRQYGKWGHALNKGTFLWSEDSFHNWRNLGEFGRGNGLEHVGAVITFPWNVNILSLRLWNQSLRCLQWIWNPLQLHLHCHKLSWYEFRQQLESAGLS